MSNDTDYLFELEGKLFRSEGNLSLEDSKNRTHALLYIREFITYFFDVGFTVWPLSITLLDTYHGILCKNNKNMNAKEFSRAGLACFHLATCLLEQKPPKFFEEHKSYLKDMSVIELMNTRDDIINKLEGRLIRSSQIFYLDALSEKATSIRSLLILTYFSQFLISTPPSLIYETCVYLLKVDIKGRYTPDQMSVTCEAIHNLLENIKTQNTYDLVVKSEAKTLKNIIKECSRNRAPVQTHKLLYKKSSAINFTNRNQLEALGEGTFAEVFKVQSAGKMYAVKHFGDAEVIKEIANLYLLRNISVISIEGFIMDKCNIQPKYGVGCKAFVFLEVGEFDLYNVSKLSRIPLDFNSMIIYFKQMLSGLAYFMYNDFLHRDIKPSNVVWVKDSSLKIGGHFKFIDFGSSMPYSKFAQKDINGFGTVVYKAPEMLLKTYNGVYNYSYKSDVWALGLVFWFIITKEDYFEDEHYIKIWDANIRKYGRVDYGYFANVDMLFQMFGTPDFNEWPGSDQFQLEKITKYNPDTVYLKNNLGEFYPFIIELLHPNPYERHNADVLLKCLEHVG